MTPKVLARLISVGVAIAATSCAPIPPTPPIVDGATHRVSRSNVRVAVNIFKQAYVEEGEPAPRINRVHIVDQNNIEIHYHPAPDQTDEWRTVVRVKGKWRLDRVIISIPKNQTYIPLRESDLN